MCSGHIPAYPVLEAEEKNPPGRFLTRQRRAAGVVWKTIAKTEIAGHLPIILAGMRS